MQRDNLRIAPAQRPFVLALHEYFAGLKEDMVLSAEAAQERQLFSEDETPRALSVLDLFERFVDAAPPFSWLLRELSTAESAATIQSFGEAEAAIAKREGLDPRDRQAEAKILEFVRREYPHTIPKYGRDAQ
jgi:hypothetical protein